MILDILDTAFVECMGQWNKRRKFYVECGYALRWQGAAATESASDSDAEGDKKRGVPLFVDEDAEPAPAPAPAAAPKKKGGKKKASTASEVADIISHVTRGNALFVDDDS